MITFEEFDSMIKAALKEKPAEWRDGQFVFNYIDKFFCVARIAQYKYGIDCFYIDANIDEFIKTCYDILSNKEGMD